MEDVVSTRSSPAIERSPLLRLPAELREKIFACLIPDVPEIDTWAIEKAMLRPQLREDGEPCCPALLRINRKAHHELSRLWYSNKPYTIFVGPRRLRDMKYMVIFCGSRFSPGDALPTNIRLLRFAFLDIQLSYNADSIEKLLAGIVQLLSSPEIMFERLKLRIRLSIELFVMRSYDEEGAFWAYLDANLNCLKALRGGPEVHVQVDGDPDLASLHLISIIPLSRQETILKLTCEYLRALLGGKVIEVTIGSEDS
jgi:hypothetical protein